MKKLVLFISLFTAITAFAQEGTKQLMPTQNDTLWLEFNVFSGNDFGGYDSDEKERINIYLNKGEKLYFGMKMNTYRYTGNVETDPYWVYFQFKNPAGQIVFNETWLDTLVGSTGYINDYTEAVTGPNGVILNEDTIKDGYDALSFTADTTGNYYFEIREAGDWRFALEFFDVTVTDSDDNVITNPDEPNRSAGRLWSYSWQLCNTSFTRNPVNANFYVVTDDRFINKVNFEMTTYSFVFLANEFGITPNSSETNYIKRTQSMELDQISGTDIAEYPVFLNDPDREVWPNILLTPPKVQVWGEEELFMDYDYYRDPMYLDIEIDSVILEKNREDSCSYDDITFFKIESSLDGYAVVLIDIDGDGEYSSNDNDRVIYCDLKKGLNYVLWDFTTDAGAAVPDTARYNASATFLGRGPSHFPLYDVEQLSGITTSAIRPFEKLNTTIYWDDTQIDNWGDNTGTGLMDDTQQKQLRVENNVSRTWSWAGVQNDDNNGNLNTMNTWFNALDLGYTSFDVVVNQSLTKCVDGSAPYVGDVYLEGDVRNEGDVDTSIVFDVDDLDNKFFHATGATLSSIEIVSLPSAGTLYYNGSEATAGLEVTRANIDLLKYIIPLHYNDVDSLLWKATASNGQESNNQDNIYFVINTKPTISEIDDQKLCTNTPTSPIQFTVTDEETDGSDLIVTGFSANPEFVPHSGINIEIVENTDDTIRTVTVTPVANKSGRAIIYIMVDDGLSQTIEEFAVTVSPSLEFDGDTNVCIGNDLYLIAEEVGATYSWKYKGSEIATSRILEQAAPVDTGQWSLTITKDVEGETCISTRYFNVNVGPLTTFEGDLNICTGEDILLKPIETNAVYQWIHLSDSVEDRDTTYNKNLFIESADSAKQGDYSLSIEKYGCPANVDTFTISIIDPAQIGKTVTGNTIDPGHDDGAITIENPETGITYNIYHINDSTNIVATETALSTADLTIDIGDSDLSLGDNIFVVGADNGNCETFLSYTGTIVVRTPGFTISTISNNTNEDLTTATFSIHLDTEPTNNVTVNLSSDDETEGTVSPSSLTFTSANYFTDQIVTATGVDDNIIDGDIDLSISIATISDDDNYDAFADAVSVTNEDNDIAEVLVAPNNGLTTTEAGGTDQFNVSLACIPNSDVEIDLSSSDPGEGIVTSATTITLTSANWNTGVNVTVTGVDDAVDDGDQVYSINTSQTSSGDSNFEGLDVSNIQISNSDDDEWGYTIDTLTVMKTNELRTLEAQFSIVLHSQPTENVTIGISSSDVTEGTVSAASITFTPTNWSEPDTITIYGVDDAVDDGDIPYKIITDAFVSGDGNYSGQSLEDVDVKNIDDDAAGLNVDPITGLITSEDGDQATFDVSLNSEPINDIVLSITSNNTDEGTGDTELTFTTSNWNSVQQVTITGQDDDMIDGDVGYTVTVSVTSGDAVYTSLSDIDVSLTNTDNDVAGLDLNKTSLSTSETATSDSLQVRLTAQPSSTVNLSITGLDATEGSINTTSLSYTTSNWDTYQKVKVTGVDDAMQDGNQNYNLTIAYNSGDTDFDAVNEIVSVENSDDDIAGVSVSPSSRELNITEGGAVGTIIISLNTRPAVGSTVTYNFTSPDEDEITLSTETAVFTYANWDPVEIDITALNDTIDDDNQSYTINLGSATSDDTNYDGLSAGSVTVNVTDIHTAGITTSAASGNTSEDLTTATYTVVLNTKPTANVTITSASQDTGEGTVISGGTLTFTPDNWDQPQTVTVIGVNDDLDDGDQPYTVSVQVSSTDSKYGSSLNKSVSLTNNDNDTAGISVSPISGNTSEDLTNATFSVVLDTEPTDDVTISFNSSNTGEGTVSPASVVFTSANWSTARIITVTGVNDDVDDGDQDYQINIGVSSDDSNYGSSMNTFVEVTNLDNDDAGVSYTGIAGLITTEAGGTDNFTVVLTSQPTANVEINFTSNKSHEGYVINENLTFTDANWDQAQTITIKGVDDYIDDGDSTYTILTTITAGDVKYLALDPVDPIATNQDDDAVGVSVSAISNNTTEATGVNHTATFTIVLESEPIADVIINISSDDITEGTVSNASVTFTSGDWFTAQTITVTGVNENIVDGDIEYHIQTSMQAGGDALYNAIDPDDVVVTNIDNDVANFTVNPTAALYTSEDGGTATFNVRLTSKPYDDVVITLNSDDVTEGTVDKHTLTFTAGNWNVNQLVTITGKDDYVDDESIAFSIIIEGDATTSDTNYVNVDPHDVSVTNTDDDSWGFTISPLSLSINENGSSQSFTVALNSQPTDSVKFAVTSDNTGRATINADSLRFAPDNWNVLQTITVSPVPNQVDDGDATFDIITSAAISNDNNYKSKNPSDVSVSIVDDDNAGINVSGISGNTSEDGDNANFTIVLESEPTDDVTIDISSSNTDEGTVSDNSVTFTSANWNIPVEITVSGQDDALADGNQTYYIQFAASVSTDSNYDGINLSDIEVVNTDDDSPGVTVFPTSNRVTTEAGGTDQFTVRLNSQPTNDVTITLSSDDETEGTISPTSLTFTSGNYSTAQTVTITGQDDIDNDGDITYNIVTSDGSSTDGNYDGIAVDDVVVENQDDTIPRLNDDADTTDEDTDVNINVLANDNGLDDGNLGLTISTEPIHGNVTIEADNSITYSPNGLYNGKDSLNYVVCDGENDCDTAKVVVTVTWADDFPVAVGDNRGTSLNTDVDIDVLFNDYGLEDGGIDVSIEEAPDVTEGVAVDNPDNTITFTPENGFTGESTFIYKITDTDGDTDTAIVTIVIHELNHTPDAINDHVETNVNVPVAINVLSNDTGLEDGFKDIRIYSDPANGTTSINANRTITYTPKADYIGSDDFIYLIEDLDGDYDTATVSVNIFAVGDAQPVAVNDSRATNYETAVNIDVLINDSGLEDGVNSLGLISEPSNGTYVVEADYTITYTPNSGFDGEETFIYQVCDTDGDCATATVTVTVYEEDEENHVPIALGDNAETMENTAVDINVLANDSGLEDGFGRINIFVDPTNGDVLVNSNRTITYTPKDWYVGDDQFIYWIEDVDGDFDTAYVYITVNEEPNHVPVAVDDSRGTEYETLVTVDVLTNDSELQDVPIVVDIVTDPQVSEGSVTVNSENNIEFTPANGYSGTSTFEYNVTDADGDADTALVTITVKEDGVVNYIPDAINDNAETIENTAVSIDILENDLGLEDGYGNLIIHNAPDNGDVVVNSNRTITYTPMDWFVGTDEFIYWVEDVDGDYDTATVTITVTEVPDYLPVAVDDSRGTEYQTPVNVDVLINDSGLEDGVDTVIIETLPVQGTVSVNADNTILFTPADGFEGLMTFEYRVTDMDGDYDIATVSITVKEEGVVNHIPVAVNDTVSTYENIAVEVLVLANDTILDGFGDLKIFEDASHGELRINDTRTITYTPSQWFVGMDEFKYWVEDVDGDYDHDIATVYITVTEVPNAIPVANDDSRATEYNIPLSIDVLTNDDGLSDTPISLLVTTQPSEGTAVVNGENIDFTPAADYSGTVSFSYTVTDANGDSDDATVTVTVLEDGVINHIPVAVNDAAETVFNTAVTVNVLANDTVNDGFGDLLIHTAPGYGNVVVNSNHTITYTPSNLFVGSDSFEYWVEDIHGDYDIATVSITVTEIPDAIPVAFDDSRATEYNTPLSIDVLTNDDGLSDIPITLSVTTQPSEGTASVNGEFIDFTPVADYSGTVNFTYRVTDADGDSDDATVTVTVLEDGVTNHIPVAVNDAAETVFNTAVTVNVLANDTVNDGFGDLLIHTEPDYGNVVVNSNHTITYTPSNLFVGSDSFEYWVEDVHGDYDIATVSITVTETPDAIPVANDDSRATEYNTVLSIDVLTNDDGLGDTPITLTVTQPSEGTASVNGEFIDFTPAADYSGTVSFTYTVTDADGDSDDATVIVTVLEDGVINHIPVAVNDAAETVFNTAVTVNVLTNDTLNDGFGDLIIHTEPGYGSVVINSNRTITYTPSNLFVGSDSFEYWVEDIHGDYDIATVSVTVTEISDAIPVAFDDSRGTEYNTPVTIDVLTNDTGLEDGGLVVIMESDPAQGSAIVNANNTVTYTPANGFTGPISMQYRVTDADGDFSVADILVTVKEEGVTNYVPNAVNDNAQTNENVPVDINVLANDSGLEDGFGKLIIFDNPENGNVVINANRTITFTPMNLFVGTDEFKYWLEDVDGDYDTASVVITVTKEGNHLPKAFDDAHGTEYETPVKIDVLSNDSGLEDGGIVLSIETEPVTGSTTINGDNTITFNPATAFTGIEIFQYRVTDNEGEYDTAYVQVTVKAEGETNYIPVALNDTVETTENEPVNINILANDTIVDGFGKILIYEDPVNGTVDINTNRTITYTPANAYIGKDSLIYWIEDAEGDYDMAKVYITVTSTPDYQPIANDDSRGTEYETPVTIDVITNDDGLEDAPVIVSILSNPQVTEGSVTVNADNTITFTPASGYSGTSSFQYTVTDADGDSDNARVTVTILEDGVTNHLPVAEDDNVSTIVNTSIDINVLSNDTGLDDGFGDLSIYTQPSYGAVVINSNRTITYTPYNMFVGVDSLEYWVEDVHGDYDIAKVIITVNDTPDYQPVANDDSRATEYETALTVDVLVNDTGLEDNPVEVTILSDPQAAEGSAVVNSDNTIRFTPANGYSGTSSFEYTVTDVDGDSDDGRVTITVLEDGVTNNIPIAEDDNASTIVNTTVDINVLSNDTGLDDGFGDLTIYDQPSFGTVTVNSNRTITYTPNNLFVGTDEFEYWVEDIHGDYDIATVTIAVTEEPNYVPVANDDRRGTSLNTAVNVDVLVNDTGLEDGGILISIESNPDVSEGTVTVNGDNTIRFTPVTDYIGQSVFSYIVEDIDGDKDTADVTITVKEGTNYVPDAVDDNISVIMNQTVTANILANDLNLNDGIGKLLIFEQPQFGTIVVNDNFTVTYEPSEWFVGSDSFKYWIEDIDGDYDTARVFISITETVNNIPVANDDSRGTSIDTEVTVDVLFNDTGLEDGGIIVSIQSNPENNGIVAVNADNTITYTPDNGYIGTDQFEYRVCDKDNDCDVGTVVINVRENNAVPLAVDDKFYINVNESVNLDILSNDTGLEDGGIEVEILTDILVGEIIVNADNTISYMPLTGYEGLEYLAYLVSDVDGDYDIGMITIEISSGTLPGVSISSISGNTSEDGTTATFDVVLDNQPTKDVSIELSSSDETEGILTLDRLTFTIDNWDLSQQVTVTGIDDDVDDGDIDYQIVLNNAISNDLSYNGLNVSNVDVTNVDDDEAGIYIHANSIETSENGTTVDIKVVLNSKPLSDVEFTVESSDLTEGDVNPFAVLFTTNNWSDTTEIRVTGIDDNEVDGDIEYDILISNSSSTDINYNGIELSDITFTNIDNDTKTLRIPEAFSPGKKDGINDNFVIENLQHNNRAKLRVYNRWGSLVYSSDHYKNDWNGKSNKGSSIGSELPTGTYFYILEIEGKSDKINGYVFIKR